tara:strand:+ start:293010 stop:294206 length:1197 start_codon:yes stop_codon:yes gene_type:complete
MKNNKRVLWLVPKWTLPATDGARVATKSLLRNVAQMGVEVDLACLSNEEAPQDFEVLKSELGLEGVYFYRRASHKLHWLFFRFVKRPFAPLTMSSFCDEGSIAFLKKCIEQKNYDAIVLDGLHLCAPFILGKGLTPPKNVKLIYRAHNVEHDLWFASSKRSNSLVKSLIFRWQGALIKKVEEKTLRNCAFVAPISQEDSGWIKSIVGEERVLVTPLGLKFEKLKKTNSSRMKNFLFIGRLDWEPNRRGLEWFLLNVWCRIDHRKAKLHICGSGRGDWLHNHLPMPGVIHHGFVRDVNEIYQKVDACIAPIFFGSGTRIKVVEPYTKNRPVITTSMGAQGSGLIPGVHYIEADSAKEWVDAISNFSRNHSQVLVDAGVEKLKATMDEKVVAHEFCKTCL